MYIRLNGDADRIGAAKQIRKHRTIPVISITANTDDTAMRRASELGPLEYLSKTLDVMELRGIMQTVTSANTSRYRTVIA